MEGDLREQTEDRAGVVEIASIRLDEARLLDAVRRGDTNAAVDFFDVVGKAVRRSLFQVLGPNDPDFDDVFQASLEKIVLSVMRKRFVQKCSISTWAAVVASRTAIDLLRKRRTERRVFLRNQNEETPDVPAAESLRPDRQAALQSDLSILRRALGKLSPDKSQTIVLFEVMGHDLDEIAQVMGVSVAAAQSRLVRARKELSRAFEREVRS